MFPRRSIVVEKGGKTAEDWGRKRPRFSPLTGEWNPDPLGQHSA